jgi:hypothetical protein
MTTKDQLFKEYVKVLQSKVGTDYFYTLPNDRDIDPETIAGRMFEAIEESALKGSRNDWINANPALKQACKKLGITTNKELRDVMIEGLHQRKTHKPKTKPKLKRTRARRQPPKPLVKVGDTVFYDNSNKKSKVNKVVVSTEIAPYVELQNGEYYFCCDMGKTTGGWIVRQCDRGVKVE